MEEKKQAPINWGQELWDFLKMLLISIVVVFLCTRFLIRPVRVDGDSMYPTLHNNAIGFSNILTYRMQGLKRFDIAIIYVPDKKEYLVKRVIGLPGETIEYRQDQLLVNGEAVAEDFFDEDYKRSQSANGSFTQDFGPVTLADDEYFMLGDNRPYSSDSRWYGPFKKEQIKAKDVVVLFPFQQIGVH